MGTRTVAAGCLGLLILFACGRRGEPLPPRAGPQPRPPAVALLARAGDQVLVRMPGGGVDWFAESAPAPPGVCALDATPARHPMTHTPWPGWWAAPLTTNAHAVVRVSDADGSRSGDWLPVPARRATPGPVTLSTMQFAGRVTLTLDGTRALVWEERVAGRWLLHGPAITHVVELGPYPPQARVALRFWPAAVTDRALALAPLPLTAVVTIR